MEENIAKNGNGAASAEEYMQKQLRQYEVKLPSGSVFLIRLPNLFWHAENVGGLPAQFLERAINWNPLDTASAPPTPRTAEEMAAFQAHRRKMIEDCVLQPKIRRPANKEAGELDPMDLDERDAEFIVNYLAGAIDRDGRPLRREAAGVPLGT
jgi:hypothetical protein